MGPAHAFRIALSNCPKVIDFYAASVDMSGPLPPIPYLQRLVFSPVVIYTVDHIVEALLEADRPNLTIIRIMRNFNDDHWALAEHLSRRKQFRVWIEEWARQGVRFEDVNGELIVALANR
jgi:hypothetical protein